LSQIFRKKALERLSSPEQLDTLLHITSPGGWAGLAAAGFCLITALLWGIYGSVPFKVTGQGLLMNQEGVFTIQSEGSGLVEQLFIEEQDDIFQGQTIAILSQPDLLSELEGMQRKHDDLKTKYKYVKEFGDEGNRQKLTTLESQKQTLNFNIDSYKKRISRLEQKVEDQKYLYDQGLITHDTLHASMNELDDTQAQVMSDKVEIENISSQIADINNNTKLQLIDLQNQINGLAEDIKTQETKVTTSSLITSPYSGTVIGVTTKIGAFISPGASIMSVKVRDNMPHYLKVISFFPASKGEKVIPGMTIQVAPGNIDADRYGYALGLVTYVSQFPATSGDMQRILQNEDMVKDMLAPGPLVEVHSLLVPDTTTPSGFKWTSAKGPPIKVQPGTYCYASVIVEKRSPLSLALPLVRKYVLGVGMDGDDGR